jgi:hypothetical protein
VQGTVANTLKLLVQAELFAPAAAATRRSCLLLLYEHNSAGYKPRYNKHTSTSSTSHHPNVKERF